MYPPRHTCIHRRHHVLGLCTSPSSHLSLTNQNSATWRLHVRMQDVVLIHSYVCCWVLRALYVLLRSFNIGCANKRVLLPSKLNLRRPYALLELI